MPPQKILIWTNSFKNKGSVVLHGDVVRDNSGSYAVFTEQESFASHMTAAKVPNVVSTLPECAGKASDAVFAYTQVKMEDSTFWEFQIRNVRPYGLFYLGPDV